MWHFTTDNMFLYKIASKIPESVAYLINITIQSEFVGLAAQIV